MFKNLIVAASLSVMAVSAFAQTTTRRTEATGERRVMNVGSCQTQMTTDINGKPRIGYLLPVTYCVEYRSYDAIKHGSGWNADYQQVGEARFFSKMSTTSESFTSLAAGQTNLDDSLISLDLAQQCERMERQLKQVTNTAECK